MVTVRTKRILSLLLMLLLLGGMITASAADPGPELSAGAVLLADGETGEILFEKNADEIRAPASLTKIMTVLLAVESIEEGMISADEMITAGEDCLAGLDDDSSSAGIKPGERMRLYDLMCCAMLGSANESCNIIASALGGSVDAFVARMNERAEELGCTKTHFVNPNGLPADGHVSTARDLLLVGREAMSHPLFRELSAMTEYEVPATDISEARWLENSNALLNDASLYGSEYVYEGCVGLKTGYTADAGYCLVSAVKRNGLYFLAVVLGCDGVNTGVEGYGNFSESIKLYDWAFDRFESRRILSAGQSVYSVSIPRGKPETLELYPAEDLYFRVSRQSEAEPVYSFSLDESMTQPPVEEGTVMGQVTVTVGSQSRTVDLVCRQGAERRTVFSSALFWIGFALLVILGFVAVCELSLKRRKRGRVSAKH